MYDDDLISDLLDNIDTTPCETNNALIPIVKVGVIGEKALALLDTGSQITAISDAFVQRIRNVGGEVATLPTKHLKIKTAVGNKTTTVKSVVCLDISINNVTFATHAYVIPDLTNDLILGIDWLKLYEVTMNFSLNLIVINKPGFELNISLNKLELNNNSNIEHKIKLVEMVEDEEIGMGNSDENSNERVKYNEKRDCHDRFVFGENHNLNESQKNSLIVMLNKYDKLFDDRPGLVLDYECHLNVDVHKDVFVKKTYPVPLAKLEAAQREIDRMLEWGIIESSESEYSNPLLVVPKKNNAVRLCLDARNLNKIIIPDRESTRPMDEILSKFNGCKCLSSLDLSSGYWQVPLDKESRKYTAFLFKNINYQFKVLPFGINNSVAIFNKCLNKVLGKGFESFMTLYVDDILVTSKSFDDHIKHLSLVFDKLLGAGMTIKASKSEFMKEKITYLGHVISTEHISINPNKMEIISNFPEPKCKKDLQSFLGLCNFFRKFIKHFSNATSGLSHLLKKHVKWKWGEDERKQFQIVKESFVQAVELRHPDFSKEFYITCDASGIAVGAHLCQYNDEGDAEVIMFASRKLNDAETRYTITELELLAIVFACRKFRTFILGHSVTLKTDHKALMFLNNGKFLSNRLMRWMLYLQEYNLTIEYCPGKDNVVADVLSRYPVVSDSINKRLKEQTIVEMNKVKIETEEAVRNVFKNMSNLQSKNSRLDKVRISMLRDDEQGQRLNRFYVINNGVLFYRSNPDKEEWRVCIPEEYCSLLIRDFHARIGHFGSYKTYKVIRSLCDFPNMKRLVSRYVTACDLCQKAKINNQPSKGAMRNVIANEPLELLSVDLFGPLPRGRGGVETIFVVLDVFTKFVKLYPVKRATTKVLLNKILDDYVVKIGKPGTILSDHGSQFASHIWKGKLEESNIRVKYSAVYHPQSNQVERVMRELGRMFRTYCHENHTSWANYIGDVEYWINCAVHDSTGVTPFELVMGKKPEMLIEKLLEFPRREDIDTVEKIEIVRKQLKRKAEQRKLKHDKGKLVQFKVDDLVLEQTQFKSSSLGKTIKKFFLLYQGPYKISKVLNNNAYVLVHPVSGVYRSTRNVIHLKKYVCEETVEGQVNGELSDEIVCSDSDGDGIDV